MTKLPKLIRVTPNDFALVDAEDFKRISKYRWHLHNGYAYRSGFGQGSMHREVLRAKKGQDTDHKNSNGLDNRKSNLRRCTESQNLAWARKQRFKAKGDRITTSRFKGVSFRSDRLRWQAYCGTGKNREHLGCYSTEEEAARAYNKAAKKMYGEFARLNDA